MDNILKNIYYKFRKYDSFITANPYTSEELSIGYDATGTKRFMRLPKDFNMILLGLIYNYNNLISSRYNPIIKLIESNETREVRLRKDIHGNQWLHTVSIKRTDGTFYDSLEYMNPVNHKLSNSIKILSDYTDTILVVESIKCGMCSPEQELKKILQMNSLAVKNKIINCNVKNRL